MGKETVLFKSEEKKDLSAVTAFLRELADKLDTNKVVLIQGNKTVKLKVPSTVEMEIKVEKEEGKRRTKKKLELEIEWVVGSEGKRERGKVKLG